MAQKELISLIMKELAWNIPISEKLPQNQVVITAEVEDWNRVLAQAFGFPDLIPSENEAKMYHIAVGKNSQGDVVGAKLLQETAKDLPMREISLNFLNMRAQMIFGIAKKESAQDD